MARNEGDTQNACDGRDGGEREVDSKCATFDFESRGCARRGYAFVPFAGRAFRRQHASEDDIGNDRGSNALGGGEYTESLFSKITRNDSDEI